MGDRRALVACLATLLVRKLVTSCIGLACILLLDACTESPLVPTIQIMPGRGKSFWTFYDDRASCRRSADKAVRDQAQRANLQMTGFATPATVLVAGPSTRGGFGMLQSSNVPNAIQAQFDYAFAQCMVSLGNSVPSMGLSPPPESEPSRQERVLP